VIVTPATTLVDRALLALGEQARPAQWLATNILGLASAPPLVAERLAAALLGADPRVHRLGDGSWAIVPVASGAPLLEECAFAVVDVETTGAAGRADRITEIAVVLVQGERCETVFETLVNPGRPIPKLVSTITGITNEMVQDAPSFEDVAEELLHVLAGRVFVAHNVRFDWRFLSEELSRTRALRLEGSRLCTVRLARRLVPGAESCNLDWLTTWFGLENPARHRAGGDAQTTARLLHRLIRLAREAGARTLSDLELMQRRMAKKRKRPRRGTPPAHLH